MAFGIKRDELERWKKQVARGEIAFLTHFWFEPRFPGCHTVTKVGCSDLPRLTQWCLDNGLDPRYIHHRQPFPHFDLVGPKQREILQKEQQFQQMSRFGIMP